MTDVPIIFSAPMVKALLSGEKRQTRRLAWREASTKKRSLGLCRTPWARVQSGDRLWVRENFVKTSTGIVCYVADGDCEGLKITPSIHMPRALSRLTLVVDRVWTERLNDIAIADVIAEGIAPTSPIGAFAELWDRLHGAGAWARADDVVAINFRALPANIDMLPIREAA